MEAADLMELDGIEEDENAKEDEWARYLNWATEDNPDGVGVVHDAMDQVSLYDTLVCAAATAACDVL